MQKKLPITFNHLIATYKHINLNQVYQLISMVGFNYYCGLIFVSHWLIGNLNIDLYVELSYQLLLGKRHKLIGATVHQLTKI